MGEADDDSQLHQQQQALASLMSYLDKQCPEMALFGVFIDKFECDESSNNVRIWFKNGNYFEGAFSGGTMDGVGKYQWSTGLSYHGTFQKNTLEGFGTYCWPDGSSYEGDVKDGQCHGNGLMRLPNGQLYNGQWNGGRKDGTGTMTYDANGQEYYSGEWSKERRHGFGTYQHGPEAANAQYSGNWTNGCRHGTGTAVWPVQRQVYSGYWDRGTQQGVGRHVWSSDRATPAQYQLQNSYIGDWSAGQRHGKGTYYYAGGASYSGQWVDNIKHGSGKITFKNGQNYDGIFDRDRLVGGPGYIDIARTPDPRLFERQLSRKVDNDETLSDFLMTCIPHLIENPLFNVERCEGPTISPSTNSAEAGMAAVKNCCTVLLRFASELRRVFSFYCDLGYRRPEDDPNAASAANSYGARSLMRMLWWRLVKDSRMPFGNIRLPSVADLDRRLAMLFKREDRQLEDIHDILHPVLFGDFLLWLLATALFTEGYGRPGYLTQDAPLPPASVCLERFLTEFIFPNCCIVHGRLFASQENSASTLRNMSNLMQFYSTIADTKTSENDKTVSGRQLVAVLVASGVSPATPVVRALTGNVFLLSHNNNETDPTSHVFAELTPLEVGETLAEVAEFINDGVIGSATLAATAGTAGDEPPASALRAEHSHTILGSILQESNNVDANGAAGPGLVVIRGTNHDGTATSLPLGRIDWTNIVQHLLSFPDLADLPRLAMSVRQTTLSAPPGRVLSGVSSSDRSMSPQARAATEGES